MEDEMWELLDLPEEEPDSDVFGYLYAAIDHAGDELASLNTMARDYVEAIAKVAVEWKESVVVDADRKVFFRDTKGLFKNPWFRHAAEVRLADGAVDRASRAFDRWLDLEPIITSSPLPEAATEYVQELTQTYLYGFDAACIAFCGAAIEQVLGDALVRVGEYTAPQLKREKPTGGILLVKAKRRGILLDTEGSAQSIMEHRNKVMHRRVWEPRIIRPIALGCIKRFGEVVGEIERRGA